MLTTKFLRPTADPRSVQRARLRDLLDPASPKRLNLVVAPAGFGKTTLLSQWCAGWTGQTAWLSLDDHDSEPRRFWQYVAGAFQHGGMKGLEDTIQQLNTVPLEEIEGPVTALINHLTTQDQPWCLLLDDFHLISHPDILRQIAYLLEYLPPNITVTIASRTEPPLPLARWRVRRWVQDILPSMLAFSEQECRHFFRDYMKTALSDEQLKDLHRKTEGWVAAMQLSVISGARPDETGRQLPVQIDEKQLNDFVLGEVLEQQSPAIRQFLLDTAFCPRLSASLCDFTRDAEDSQSLLEELLARNLFLIPLDTRQHWFRYHDLFRDALMEKAIAEDEEQALGCWRRAITWLLDHGHVQDGIAQIARQQDWDWLARVLSEQGNNLIHGGFHLPVLDWLDKLPESLAFGQPQLMMLRLWALFFANRLNSIEPLLEQLETLLENQPDQETAVSLHSELSLIRSYLERTRSNDKSATDLTRQVLEEIDHTRIPLKSVTWYGLGLDYYGKGDLASAEEALNSAVHYGQLEQKASTVLSSGGMLAWIEYNRGDLDLALENCTRVRRWVDEHYSDDPANPRLISCWQNSALTELYRERNQKELAEYSLAPLLEHVKSGTEPGQHVVIQYVRGHLAFSYGDIDAAIRYLTDASLTASRRKKDIVFEPPACEAMLARCYLAKGELERARQWMEQLDPGVFSNPLNLEQSRISCARVLVATGEPVKAIEILAPLRMSSERDRRYRHLVEIQVVYASALLAEGKRRDAQKLLSVAMEKARSAGFLRLFVEEGPEIREALRDMPQLAEPGAWNQNLRAILTGEPEPRQSDSDHSSRPASEDSSASDSAMADLIEPLSQRELEVLKLINEGLANKEIAQQMAVAPATVKAHIRNLYGKLDVRRRTEALARARDLGLLD